MFLSDFALFPTLRRPTTSSENIIPCISLLVSTKVSQVGTYLPVGTIFWHPRRWRSSLSTRIQNFISCFWCLKAQVIIPIFRLVAAEFSTQWEVSRAHC